MQEPNVDIELIDFLDLIDWSLSTNFIEKWKFKYSSKFLKKFQFKLLEGLSKRKRIKKSTLFTYLSKTSGYNPEQVESFFEAIEIDIYRPLIG